jgi:hypothetical protein
MTFLCSNLFFPCAENREEKMLDGCGLCYTYIYNNLFEKQKQHVHI